MFLADASFIVSPFAKTPARRKWAQMFFEKHKGRLWTTAAAFTEAGHLIGDPAIAAKILVDYQFLVDVEIEKPALAALLEKYAPEMDFADATLVRASELRPTFKVVTDDEHFEWYRRLQGRERIPVVWIPA
jgi:predicted nucleic acid-binding protein